MALNSPVRQEEALECRAAVWYILSVRSNYFNNSYSKHRFSCTRVIRLDTSPRCKEAIKQISWIIHDRSVGLVTSLVKIYPDLASTRFRIHSVLNKVPLWSGERIQKVVDWYAGFTGYVVVGSRIAKGNVADSKLSGCEWKGPKFNQLGCEINI